jgi:hypothetical protein
MVNDSGQIYTIEGVAAGILMVVTAYLVISTTTVLTPQDVHIIDMQLQQLGNDALAMMDTPNDYGTETARTQSMLTFDIIENNVTGFNDQFLSYLNASTIEGKGTGEYAYNATIFYRNGTDIKSYTFIESPYYRENAVKVSRWVYLPSFIKTIHPDDMRADTPQNVLLEVLVWRVSYE